MWNHTLWSKVPSSAVASSQVCWLQSPSREKQLNNKVLPNTWRLATFQYHLSCRTREVEGGRLLFRNVQYRLGFALCLHYQSVLSFLSLTRVSEGLNFFNLGADVCFWSGLFPCVFGIPPWQVGVFAQRGLDRAEAWKSNSYPTANLSVSITWEAWERREG